jgi:hypothetical protein
LERARAELYRERYQALLLQFDQVEHAAQMAPSSSNGKE